MVKPAQLLTGEELRQKYGEGGVRNRSSRLDLDNVPKQFWALIPYAEFWGVRDDGERMRLVRRGFGNFCRTPLFGGSPTIGLVKTW